ncbi:MAG: DUF456 domain-containing protein [Candidatus Hydrogenedentes bacterium]|nr:DUF456 domain-containing protein [Candidatus Hydrogenedentota bacterium]
MDAFLAILGWLLFTLTIVVGLCLDVLGLFGNWIILAAIALAWFLTGFAHFTGTGLIIMAALAVLGEIIEMLAAGYGAAKFGGGKGSAVAALVGCMLGAVMGTPLLPIVGTLIGACAGAFTGAALYEYIAHERPMHGAMWTGLGAALGRVAGLFAKLFMGFGILLVAALTYHPG